MGGRKSYSIDYVVGKAPELKKTKKALINSVKSKSTKDIVQTSIELFTKSDELLDNFVRIVDTLDFIQENVDKTPLSYDSRKKLAATFWTKTKKEKEITVPSEFDKILVKSLTKVIRRGKKK